MQLLKSEKKLSLRRFEVVTKTDTDAFGAYLHMGGRIGVLTVIEGTTDEAVAKDVAMHIAAFNPKYISRDEVSAEEVEREREVLTQQALKRRQTRKNRCKNGRRSSWQILRRSLLTRSNIR